MKRIAFIKDGKVLLVLNCDQKLYEAFTSANSHVDATTADPQLTKDWAYDGTTFIAPEAPVVE